MLHFNLTVTLNWAKTYLVARLWSLRQGKMSSLICLKAKNEEKLKKMLICPLSKSETIMLI